jgi:hypothetical protein
MAERDVKEYLPERPQKTSNPPSARRPKHWGERNDGVYVTKLVRNS